jgi:hypothetical protein
LTNHPADDGRYLRPEEGILLLIEPSYKGRVERGRFVQSD